MMKDELRILNEPWRTPLVKRCAHIGFSQNPLEDEETMVNVATQIRPALRNDLPAIEQLITQSVRLWKPHYKPAQIESSLTHLFSVDSQLLAEQTHYVVEMKDAIVGCGGWSRDRILTNLDDSRGSPEQAEIRALFVHPRRLRRGIGGRLLRTCQMMAAEAGFGQMTALATLVGAPFYRHHGFSELEQCALRLPDGELFPVVRMARQLTKAVHPEAVLCI